MKSKQYLQEIRQAAGLSRAVLRKIEVRGRTVTFYLITDKTYSGEDVEHARTVSARYTPAGFGAEVNVRKSVPDPEGIRRAVADVLKESSVSAVACLKKRGIRVAMLTGDNEYVARAVAERAGIAEYYAEVLPEDKLSYVEKARQMGGTVAMVGDGINDSPALKGADVGIAVGTGTDVAIDSADVVLVSGDLNSVPTMVDLSKAAVRNIKENLFWAFIYNCIAIPVAAGVFSFANISLNPMIAAACMSLSSLFVVFNALRLMRFGKKKKTASAPSATAVGSDTPDNDKSNKFSEDKKMTKTLKIEGMMCNHCKAHVEKALNALPGVTATVNLEAGTATVQGDVTDEALTKAVTDAGYEVVEIR